ncbi:DUF2795 domain-containing protein [Burkholderia gladioli]|uniref:DUF2795 domain-containing protein n=1 Tax=Burkholderia gladioli TaxID=28095 RepID=UPI001641CFC5|nr:DUF2795 domain-containing protein [Burkholderia gladioli]
MTSSHRQHTGHESSRVRARDAHASGPLVEALLRIPDREYASPASVAKELAKLM